jgi:hypothetical protein
MDKGYVCSDSGCDVIPGLLTDSDVVDLIIEVFIIIISVFVFVS